MLFDAPDGLRVSDANHDVRIAEMKSSRSAIREMAVPRASKATTRTGPRDVAFPPVLSRTRLVWHDVGPVLSPRPISIFQRELRQPPWVWRLMWWIPTQAELQQKSAKMMGAEVATLGVDSTLLQGL
jgi:hypothetical protein